MKKTIILAALFAAASLRADEPKSFLATLHHHRTVASTIGDNGDVNPYALIVAPVSAGKIQKDDVLVDNFNGINESSGHRRHHHGLQPGHKANHDVCATAAKLAGMSRRRRFEHGDDDA